MTDATKPDLGPEELPSLADFAEEPGGAWAPGWYAAEIIEGYATGKGTMFTTTDELSRNGTSRNLFVCITVRNGTASRSIRETLNYRPSDFDPDRLAQIKELRQEFRGQRGAWPGQADAQRSSLAIGKLGQFEKALGFRLKRGPLGALLPGVFVGQKLDVRLNVDEAGYNQVTAFAQFGSRTKASKTAKPVPIPPPPDASETDDDIPF